MAEVPLDVVTVMSTVPLPGGLVATISGGVADNRADHATEVNGRGAGQVAASDRHRRAAIRWARRGTDTCHGGAVTNVNSSDARVGEVPLAVVTVMSTVPLPGGLVATI